MKHSLRFSLIAVLLLLCMGRIGYSQTSDKGLLQYQFPLLSEYPPLSLGMSYDVLVAYIFADSMGRSVPGDSIIPLEYTMRYSDTLQQAAKYEYEADDYNPVQFFQWKYTDPTHRYWVSPGIHGAGPSVANEIQSIVKNTFPDTGETAMLLYADYIADVVVNSTVEGYDSSAAPGAVHDVKVTCTVLDPIKGQVLPACIPDPPPSLSGVIKNGSFKTQTAMGGCLQFEYCLEWNRMGPNLNMSDTNSLGNTANGRRWVHLDSEYIVFPEFGYNGGASHYNLGGCTETHIMTLDLAKT